VPDVRARPPRALTAIDQLSAADAAQLGVICKLYFGASRGLSGLLPIINDPGTDPGVLSALAVVAIEVDGVHAYDAWTYMGDSGAYFVAGTTELVGEIIQAGFESHRETPAGLAFAALHRAHPRL
jgi:hypothetical protein